MTDVDPAPLIARLETQQTQLGLAREILEGWAAHPPMIDTSEWFGVAAAAHDVALRALHRALHLAAHSTAEAHAATSTAIGSLGG
jgi:hypothetical protein